MSDLATKDRETLISKRALAGAAAWPVRSRIRSNRHALRTAPSLASVPRLFASGPPVTLSDAVILSRRAGWAIGCQVVEQRGETLLVLRSMPSTCLHPKAILPLQSAGGFPFNETA